MQQVLDAKAYIGKEIQRLGQVVCSFDSMRVYAQLL
jgi:hypothetical protein